MAARVVRKGRRVLDVGCGVGSLTRRYAAYEASVEVVGLDLSPLMVGHAHRLNDGPNVTYVCADVVDYAASRAGSDVPFDVVVFNACFQNLFDPSEGLRCAEGLLRPGGACVVSYSRGADYADELRRRDPLIVPHALPRSAAALAALLPEGTRLDVAAVEDGPYYYAELVKRGG